MLFQSFGEFVECAGLDSTVLQYRGPEMLIYYVCPDERGGELNPITTTLV